MGNSNYNCFCESHIISNGQDKDKEKTAIIGENRQNYIKKHGFGKRVHYLSIKVGTMAVSSYYGTYDICFYFEE